MCVYVFEMCERARALVCVVNCVCVERVSRVCWDLCFLCLPCSPTRSRKFASLLCDG